MCEGTRENIKCHVLLGSVPSTYVRTCGLVFKAHRLLCHSTLGLRVIKKKTSVPSHLPTYAPRGIFVPTYQGVCLLKMPRVRTYVHTYIRTTLTEPLRVFESTPQQARVGTSARRYGGA